MRRLVSAGFTGSLYLITTATEEIAGISTYPSLSSVPGFVDYVSAYLPKNHILDLLDDCRERNVAVLQMFTGGLAESEQLHGIELEHEIACKARSLGIRLLGPNCVGVYNPSVRLSIPWLFPEEAWRAGGHTGFICQSGGNTAFVIEAALLRGVHFSKAVSFGNASDINAIDLLEYLGTDPQTTVIGAYEPVAQTLSQAPESLILGGLLNLGVSPRPPAGGLPRLFVQHPHIWKE